jgi:hypothetical protein
MPGAPQSLTDAARPEVVTRVIRVATERWGPKKLTIYRIEPGESNPELMSPIAPRLGTLANPLAPGGSSVRSAAAIESAPVGPLSSGLGIVQVARAEDFGWPLGGTSLSEATGDKGGRGTT